MKRIQNKIGNIMWGKFILNPTIIFSVRLAL